MPGVAERFWSKVDRQHDCWVWTGAHHPKGYGLFKRDGKLELAQRVSWELVHGTAPAGPLRRRCDTAACVRPDHYDAPRSSVAAKTRRRLPRGAGSIRQRSPGSYTVEIFGGRDPIDRRRRLRTTFTVRGSFEDAARAAEDYRAQARLGDRINEAAAGTFGALLNLWLEHARLEADTRRTYQGYIDNQIKPAIGAIPLRGLSTFDLDRFYKAVAERGGKCRHCWWRIRNGHTPLGPGAHYRPSPKAAIKVHETDCVRGLPLAPASQRQIHAVIHRALAQAKKWKLISVNPASDTSRTPVPEPVLKVPRSQEVALVLATASDEDPNFGLFVWMTIITGGRRGEACGIRWSTINTHDSTLAIAEVIKSGGKPKPYPKNRKQRILQLDPVTLSLLEAEHTAQQQAATAVGVTLRLDGYVFAHHATPDGSRPCDPDHLSKRFHRLCDLLGVQLDRNLYALRHFAATDLLRSGVDIRTIAGRLGNDPAVALRRYSHFVGEADRQAVAQFSTRLQDALTELGAPVTAATEHRRRGAHPRRSARRGGWGWPGTPLFPSSIRKLWSDRQLPSAVCQGLGLPLGTTADDAHFPTDATPTTAGRAVITLAPWFAHPEIASLPLAPHLLAGSGLGAVRWQGRTKALLTRIARDHPGGLVAWLATATVGDLMEIRRVGPATVLDTMVGLEICSSVDGGPGAVVASMDQPG
jgi:integrase